ncbi:MAG: hypothetical protein WB564_06430 [Dehalococcoidia bacterium]
MRKLISIGLVLALLVMFVVPVAVAADGNCTTCPTADTPCPVPTPACATRSPGGALLWALLGTTYIMGNAVGDVTEHLAGTLGCYVDVLAKPLGGVVEALATGLGGLIKGLGSLVPSIADVVTPLGQMLIDLGAQIESFMTTSG